MELQRYLKRGAPTSPSPSSAHRQPSPKISGTPNVLGRSLSQTALMSAPEMEFFKFVQEFVSAVLKWWGGWRIRVQIWSRYTYTREETRWRNKLFLKWIDFVFGSLKKKQCGYTVTGSHHYAVFSKQVQTDQHWLVPVWCIQPVCSVLYVYKNEFVVQRLH